MYALSVIRQRAACCSTAQLLHIGVGGGALRCTVPFHAGVHCCLALQVDGQESRGLSSWMDKVGRSKDRPHKHSTCCSEEAHLALCASLLSVFASPLYELLRRCPCCSFTFFNFIRGQQGPLPPAVVVCAAVTTFRLTCQDQSHQHYARCLWMYLLLNSQHLR